MTEEVKRDSKGWFIPGTAPGPGRPKNSFSIKDMVRQHLEENPGDLEEFIRHFIKNNRELAWQMLEGKPKANVDLGVDKEGIGELTEFFRRMAESKDDKDDGT